MLVVIFFENKLLLQPDEFFDSESNGRNFSSIAPPGGEKKLFSFFIQNDVTERRVRVVEKKTKIIFSRHRVALKS